MADPAGRFSIAFDDPTLEWDATWTHVDQVHPNLVTSYSIDRGRQFELDRTDGGRATVEILDPDGILDPTNSSGPYYGQLEPLLQARLGRYNPVTDEWFTRFRGFVDDFDYAIDPSQQLGRLTVSLVDIFEILQTVEMHLSDLEDPAFGDIPPSADYASSIVFGADGGDFTFDLIRDRIHQALLNAQLGSVTGEWFVVFDPPTFAKPGVYSPGESVMAVIQEHADAEWPGVANVYPDRFGRLCVHGRRAKFDPEGTEAGTTSDIWDFREFLAGDGEAVAAAPTTTAHIRRFAFNRGLSKIINSAVATPSRAYETPLTDVELAGQYASDATSIGRFGYRSWSALDLLTHAGTTVTPGDTNDLTETKRFAQFMVNAYKSPHNRITDIAFRSMHPDDPRAAPTWNLLTRVDIGDTVTPTVHGAAGGDGIFDGSEAYFVEGVHEESRALDPNFDDVTLSLDLSPRSLFDPENDPWTP